MTAAEHVLSALGCEELQVPLPAVVVRSPEVRAAAMRALAPIGMCRLRDGWSSPGAQVRRIRERSNSLAQEWGWRVSPARGEPAHRLFSLCFPKLSLGWEGFLLCGTSFASLCLARRATPNPPGETGRFVPETPPSSLLFRGVQVLTHRVRSRPASRAGFLVFPAAGL